MVLRHKDYLLFVCYRLRRYTCFLHGIRLQILSVPVVSSSGLTISFLVREQ